MLYAGAQKNAGPAGVTVAIMRDDMIERTPANLPVMLDYKTLSASGSLHNTPPAFAIYIVGLVFQWAKKLGGLAEVQNQPQESRCDLQRHRSKRRILSRSCGTRRAFRYEYPLPLPARARRSIRQGSQKNDLIGLKGHRSVGGMRASIYNAMSVEGRALVQLMKEFQKKNG